MAARISFIRSRRFQSERDHIGDMSSSPSAKAEYASLLEIARSARINDRVGFAMNAIHRARPFAVDPVTKFGLEREYASMLWAQGERPIAIKHLEELRARASSDPEVIKQTPSVLSQLVSEPFPSPARSDWSPDVGRVALAGRHGKAVDDPGELLQ